MPDEDPNLDFVPRGTTSSKIDRIRALAKRGLNGRSAYSCCRGRGIRDSQFLHRYADILEEAFRSQFREALAPNPAAAMAVLVKLAGVSPQIVVNLARTLQGRIIIEELVGQAGLPETQAQLALVQSHLRISADVINRKSEEECLDCVESKLWSQLHPREWLKGVKVHKRL